MKIGHGGPLPIVGLSRGAAVLGERRLSFPKGEGSGEGLFWAKRWLRDSPPHLSPFPLAKGKGGCSARLLPKI